MNKVKVGSVTLPLYPWVHPDNGREYWRWSWYDQDGKRRYGTRAKKTEAVKAARAIAREIHNGSVDLGSLNKDQLRLCKAFLDLDPTWADIEQIKASRKRSSYTVAEVVEMFTDDLRGDKDVKDLSRYHRDIVSILDEFAEDHGLDKIDDLDRPEVSDWIHSLEVGSKRKSDKLSALIRLWRWCANEDYVSTINGATPADRVKSIDVARPDQVHFLSPYEMAFVLENIAEKYRGWALLAGFSGLRSEEIHPRTLKTREPLRWEQVKLEEGYIELLASQSKNKRRRLVPIHPTLELWLRHINSPKSGIIVDTAPTTDCTKPIRNLMRKHFKEGHGWSGNCLRHNYGTYRVAETNNFPLVAKEMDNSVTIIQRHYDGVTTAQNAAEYWALNP